jgi:hypothetical protein
LGRVGPVIDVRLELAEEAPAAVQKVKAALIFSRTGPRSIGAFAMSALPQEGNMAGFATETRNYYGLTLRRSIVS